MTKTHNPRIVKTVLQTSAIITLVLGLAIILAPDRIVSWFDGYHLADYHFVRFVGTALIGFAVMNWLYSKSDDIRAVLPAIYGNLISLTLAILLDITKLSWQSLNPAAWLILGLHLSFAVAFVYCIVAIKAFKIPTQQSYNKN